MKKALKKILVIILIILTINNFLMSSVVYADDDDSLGDVVGNFLQGLLESVVGLLTYPVRFIALAAATAINTLTASVAYIEGATDPNSDMGAGGAVDLPLVPFDLDQKAFNKSITPFDIFFNRVKILDVNFFEIETEGIQAESIVNKMRMGIATWYYILRMITLAILLVILIYVGIRMAITTIASDKAMYKKMLIDWITSIVLIFFIPYIISFTLIVSNSIINAISLGVDSEKITNTYTVISEIAFRILDINSIAATIVYCMLVWQTLGLVFSYFTRMLKLAFLVIISPLITLTYSIDKMGDGKAQALGNWTKEFVYTVLIQPFHCIIYMCFIDVAFNLLLNEPSADRNTMAIAVISILCVRFVKEAEKIVRKIFDFKDDGSTSLGAGLAIASMAVSKSKNIGTSAKSAVNSVKNVGKGTAAALKGAKINALAAVKHIGNKDNVSFAETKEKVRTEINEKQATKIENRYNVKTSDAVLKKRTAEIQKSIPGITESEARSMARLEAAKKARSQKGAIRKRVNKVRGAVNKVKSVYNESEFLQGIGGIARATASTGLGVVAASGIYGTGGKLSTSLATGYAVYSTSSSFMKNTGKTIAQGVSANLHALGAKSKADAEMKMSNIIAKFSNKSETDRELKDIVDEIGEELKKVGIDEKHKSTIKNTIQNGIKADPSRTQDIINYTLGNENVTGGKIPEDERGDGVRSAIQKLADFTNESQIYEGIQNAGNIGITADTFVGQVVGNYELSYEETQKIEKEEIETKEQEKEEIVEESMDKFERKEDYENFTEKMDEIISSMTVEDLKELEKLFEEKKRELERLSQQDYEEQLEQLELQKIDLISRALADIEIDKRGLRQESKDRIKQMRQMYRDDLKNKLADMTNNANTQSGTNVQTGAVFDARKTRMEATLNMLENN